MKPFSLLLFSVFALGSLSAQNAHFGIKGGLNITFFNTDELQFGERANSQTGFYGGFFVDIEGNGNLSIQPEVLYVSINDFNFLNIPLYAKYEVARNLHLMVGPSMNYFFDFLTNKFQVGLDLGTAYNITKGIDLHVKYLLGIEAIAPNGVYFGLGVRL